MAKAKKATPKRSAIGNKLRFSIYERDEFTCQYCGKNPQDHDIILNLDHAISVKDGGDNSMENLVTSCFSCNSGKSAKSVVLKKNISNPEEALEKANQRLAQIKAMHIAREKTREAKEEMERIQFSFLDPLTNWSDDDGVSSVYNSILKICKNRVKNDCPVDILRYAFSIVEEKFLRGDEISQKDVCAYFNGVVKNKLLEIQSPEEAEKIKRKNEIYYYLYNNYHYVNRKMFFMFCEYIDIEMINRVATTSRNWSDFRTICEDIINDL